MARYIDADKLTDKLEELQFNAPVMTPVMKIYNVIELVEDQPTADVAEVKHGYWKRNECNIEKMKEFHKNGIGLSMSEKSIFYTCSCCGSWGTLTQKRCSECGAKMDGTPKERGGEK